MKWKKNKMKLLLVNKQVILLKSHCMKLMGKYVSNNGFMTCKGTKVHWWGIYWITDWGIYWSTDYKLCLFGKIWLTNPDFITNHFTNGFFTQRASNVGLTCFLCCKLEEAAEQIVYLPFISVTMILLSYQCYILLLLCLRLKTAQLLLETPKE